MRLLHTSDWHLGITLGEYSRDEEHRHFLKWLLDTLKSQQVDALLVAGDVFDTSNPPATAQRLYYDFLAECRDNLPGLHIVIIGGNHDSAGRLDAPAKVLNRFQVHVVGGLTTSDGQLNFERLCVPLKNKAGDIAAWCVAVPFIRPFDVSATTDFQQGVQTRYAEAFAAARQKRQPGQALIAMGHAFMVGGTVSDTERPIQRGHLDALPVEIFPNDVAYVALGHLHKAQTVAKQWHVRYSGSPLPLSFTERNYEHQVVLVELKGDRAKNIETIPIPRKRELLRIPPTAAAEPLKEVLDQLRQLPAATSDTDKLPPLVEVHVRLDHPQPTLKNDVAQGLNGVWAELARIETHWPAAGNSSPDALATTDNATLKPEDPEAMFRACYRATHKKDPSKDLCDTFHLLLEETRQKSSP